MKFDAVVIGGGLAGMQAAMEKLSKGMSVALFCYGRTLDNVDYPAFTAAGGTLLMGDRITGGILEDGKVVSVNSEKLGKVEAGEYVLGTGRFFSGGLSSDMNHMWETVFGLDMDSSDNPEEWVSSDYDHHQPFMDYGVRVSSDGHPYKNGVQVSNMTVVGAIVSKKK